ncbi:hypothetical protein P148_SR1C00001G0935 [candidate division SR1 bacterium RAAC1_SR1_1]|nr:hypothetical protein P148_SR1C00001G0935 [candidate division SR1 bacterium RAAC1_SR1_1]
MKSTKKKVVSKKSISAPIVKKTKKNFWLSFLAILNILAFIAVVVVNYLANALPIGGMSTGALSDLYPNLFVPIGLTFSIWGLIYLLVFGFVIWQLVDLFRKKSLDITKKIGIWFLLSCMANVGWIFAWHYQNVLLSVIVMLLFLIILIVITKKLKIGERLGSCADKLLVQIPFSVYLGRICVATIANITTLLVTIGWNMRGMTDVFWTNLVIVVAALLALISLWKKYDIVFALVIIWAFIGIILKRLGAEIIYPNIIWTLGISIAIITGGIGWRLPEWKKR